MHIWWPFLFSQQCRISPLLSNILWGISSKYKRKEAFEEKLRWTIREKSFLKRAAPKLSPLSLLDLLDLHLTGGNNKTHDQISWQGGFWVRFRVVQTADPDISTQPVVATKLTINTSTHSIYPIPTCFVFSQKSSNNWSLTCSSYLSKMLCFQNRSTTIHHFGNGISNTNRCIISKTIYIFQDLRKNDVLDVLSCDLSVVFWPKDWDLWCLTHPRVHCLTSHGKYWTNAT